MGKTQTEAQLFERFFGPWGVFRVPQGEQKSTKNRKMGAKDRFFEDWFLDPIFHRFQMKKDTKIDKNKVKF